MLGCILRVLTPYLSYKRTQSIAHYIELFKSVFHKECTSKVFGLTFGGTSHWFSSGAFFPFWQHRLSQEVKQMERKRFARRPQRLGALLLAGVLLIPVIRVWKQSGRTSQHFLSASEYQSQSHCSPKKLSFFLFQNEASRLFFRAAAHP